MGDLGRGAVRPYAWQGVIMLLVVATFRVDYSAIGLIIG